MLIIATVISIFAVAPTASSQEKKIGKDVKITWFGHAAFKLESPKGKIVLIDPWLQNPKAPANARNLTTADVILVTHGHSDHLGNTVDLAKITGAKVICIYEIALYLSEQGINNFQPMNKSGTVEVDGIKFTMVDAAHSSGIDVAGKLHVGGEAAGFVIEFENGFKVYHAGDTGLFGDMRLIGEMYKPDVALLPIGGLFTMGPREAAKACTLINPRYIIPMHYGTFRELTGTPDQLKKELKGYMRPRVIEMKPGETIE